MNTPALPPVNDPIWADIITGKQVFIFQCLAIQIILMRLTLSVKYDSTPQNILKCSTELRTMIEKNSALPSAKRDIEKIFIHKKGGA